MHKYGAHIFHTSNKEVRDCINQFVGTQINVIDWLDDVDIFVYPYIWEETFGISIVEAMFRGCIPLVSNKGGLPEVVNNQKNICLMMYKN